MTSAVKTPLPEYDSPPVVEVAVSVQFKSPSVPAPQLVLYWSSVRKRFPKLEQLLPLPSVVENLGPPLPVQPRVELRVSNAPPAPRLFLVKESGAELIQAQEDRFGYNWRRLKPQHASPHYHSIRATFAQELRGFQRFLEEEGLGAVEPTQCELTYVNHIFEDGVWNEHGEADRVIRTIGATPSANFLPKAEQVQQNSSYVISRGDGTAIGRLYCNVESRFLTADLKPIFSMSLTARGAPTADGEEGVFGILDIGHEWIVRGFTDLTTPEMHRAWRRAK